jgi:hypothetical protein
LLESHIKINLTIELKFFYLFSFFFLKLKKKNYLKKNFLKKIAAFNETKSVAFSSFKAIFKRPLYVKKLIQISNATLRI